jgi:hypothetical protein
MVSAYKLFRAVVRRGPGESDGSDKSEIVSVVLTVVPFLTAEPGSGANHFRTGTDRHGDSAFSRDTYRGNQKGERPVDGERARS